MHLNMHTKVNVCLNSNIRFPTHTFLLSCILRINNDFYLKYTICNIRSIWIKCIEKMEIVSKTCVVYNFVENRKPMRHCSRIELHLLTVLNISVIPFLCQFSGVNHNDIENFSSENSYLGVNFKQKFNKIRVLCP